LSEEENNCLFCNLNKDRIELENENAILFYDSYPVAKGHSLIIPKRHIADYFSLSATEIISINELLLKQKEKLLTEDNSIEGFNIGTNAGAAAGQTIMHCHIHLIPRRKGDMPDPRGGVRGVIPDKMKY
jgi:ATP adenylyltransferase